jgi:NodT family efflux transporter outer membrane factor (OMF) lipoprotein
MSTPVFLKSTLALALALGLAACADLSGIAAPHATPRDPASLGLPTARGSTAAPNREWWKGLGDAQLDTLVATALHNAPSLRIAQARLARAQASLESAHANTLPQVNGSLDLMRQRFTATGLYPPPLAGNLWNTGTLQLGASWELDFFGKHQAALDAALGTANALQADAQAAEILLASQITRSYVQLARLNDQRTVAKRILAQREESLRLVQERFRAGLDTRLELRQSEGGLPDARQQIEALNEQIALVSQAIAALAGSPPLAATLRPTTLAQLAPLAVPTQIPADMLGLRADIAAARWRVEAAGHDVVSAKTQFYPNINIVAFTGLSSIGINRLLHSNSEQTGVGPAVRLPIFDAGRLRANLRSKTADLDAAVDSYNATVVEAIHEVADQLATLPSLALQRQEQGAAQAAAEAAYGIAVQRYKAGITPYLFVLNTETQVLTQRRLGVDLLARERDAQIALARAVGGGYSTPATAVALAK